jgi:hypothetical protein
MEKALYKNAKQWANVFFKMHYKDTVENMLETDLDTAIGILSQIAFLRLLEKEDRLRNFLLLICQKCLNLWKKRRQLF